MKSLYLIRHAKSSWDNPALDDFDRPLNARGEGDAPKMGKRLKKKGIKPDLIISSTALRAYQTAMAIADELLYAQESIMALDELYHASPAIMLQVLQHMNDDIHTLFLVGHNPGLSDFANRLCTVYIDNIVTSGVYALQCDISSWQALWLDGKAKLLFYDYPKKK